MRVEDISTKPAKNLAPFFAGYLRVTMFSFEGVFNIQLSILWGLQFDIEAGGSWVDPIDQTWEPTIFVRAFLLGRVRPPGEKKKATN